MIPRCASLTGAGHEDPQGPFQPGSIKIIILDDASVLQRSMPSVLSGFARTVSCLAQMKWKEKGQPSNPNIRQLIFSPLLPNLEKDLQLIRRVCYQGFGLGLYNQSSSSPSFKLSLIHI